MTPVGVLLETAGGTVKASNFGAITAARTSGSSEVFGLVLGENGTACQATAGQYGVSKVIEITAGSGDLLQNPQLQAHALIAAMNAYELSAMVGICSPAANDLMARAAAIADAPLALDCVAVDLEKQIVKKSHFSGKTVATIRLVGDVMICGLRPNTVEPEEAPCEASVVRFTADSNLLPEQPVIMEIKGSSTDEVDLTEAEIIVTAGRPIAAAENFEMIRALADLLGAAVGASRAAVDAGYAPHRIQVGQTGKTVSPKLYIACGLSGSVQHFAGMKTSKTIVAINMDPHAPIFGKCDYGILGDIFEVVPALTQAIKEMKHL